MPWSAPSSSPCWTRSSLPAAAITVAPITFLAIWMPVMPRLPPAPMISTVSPCWSFAVLMRRFQAVGQGHDHTGRHADKLGKAAWALDAHHALRAVVVGAVLRDGLKRHAAGGGNTLADAPARDARPERVDSTGAVDAGNERQHRVA